MNLHQMRCFLAALERGSFTHAAQDLGLSQPALSEQIRLLEKRVGAVLFHRLGRGVSPTGAALTLLPYAQTSLRAADAGRRAVATEVCAETGTIRFGLFGAARLYIATELVAAMLDEHPGMRVILLGQNSHDVVALIRRGRLDAGVVALPVNDDSQLSVRPIARDEIVYLSHDRRRTTRPVTPTRLADAELVLSDASWGGRDHTRQQIIRQVQAARRTLRPRIEVEDAETAMALAARGYADTIASRAALDSYASQLPGPLHAASLSPALFDQFAIVQRHGTALSTAARTLITHATRLLGDVTRG